MAQLVQAKWLDKRKVKSIENGRSKFTWSTAERKHAGDDILIEDWIEYPTDDELQLDLECSMRVQYHGQSRPVYEKLVDVGYRYPYTLR